MAVWTAPPLWEGGECFIIGGGTSVPRLFGVPEETIKAVMVGSTPETAYTPYLQPLFAKHVIGINNAYKLGESVVDCLFFGDCSWYVQHKTAIYPLKMLKVTCCDRFIQRTEAQSEGIKFLAKDRRKMEGISEDKTKVSWNYNSGFASLSLAHHLGVKRIILLGFDMCLDTNHTSHWHGSHLADRRQNAKARVPPFARHMKGLGPITQDCARLGIEILNCSDISTIPVQLVRKVKLEEVL